MHSQNLNTAALKLMIVVHKAQTLIVAKGNVYHRLFKLEF
jgi:hypothetical protein